MKNLNSIKIRFKIFLVRSRLTSSYRQRLSRYRELRSRTPTAQKTPAEVSVVTEPSPNESTDESYIMINAQEILRLIEVRYQQQSKQIFACFVFLSILGSFIIIT